MTVEYAEPGASASPWNEEDDITMVWLRSIVRWSPLEPEPFVTDVPVPTEKTPCWDDPDLWFVAGTNKLDVRYAKRACQGCWMLTDCRTYALTHDVEGIWGGLTKSERSARKAKQRA